jgi:alkaline phosphatase
MRKFSSILFILAILVSLILGAAAPASAATPEKAKNVIFMIGDGMGINDVIIGDYYQGTTQVFEDFPVKLFTSTYEFEAVTNPYPYPILAPIPCPNPAYVAYGYDTTLAWTDFNYVRWSDPAGMGRAYDNNSTDSASSATAMSSGTKTKDGVLGVDINMLPVEHFSQWAENLGKSTGVVSTMPISHATPGGFSAHNTNRGAYAQIFNEQIYTSALDVAFGCGAPDFNNNGDAVAGPYTDSQAKYVGGAATWTDLSDGTVTGADANGDGSADDWTVIRTKAQFQALASGPTPDRVLGVAQVFESMQWYRNPQYSTAAAYVDPFIPGLPTLADMSKAALNVLDNNPNGFFAMIEGGAIDYGGHFNTPGRLVEEVIDFNNAVQAVVDWIEANGGWDENLLIVTADHETGYIWGPGSGMPATWNPIVDNGPGVMPGFTFNSDIGGFNWHTNSLVPMYAKGPCSDMFNDLATGMDDVRGPFIDNTDYIKVMKAAMTAGSGPQTWQLDSETVPLTSVTDSPQAQDTPAAPSLYQMERTAGPGDDGQSGKVDIFAGQAVTWIADEVALADVTFPSGAWKVEIATEDDWGTDGSNCLATFGIWDGGFYTPFSTLNLVSVEWSEGVVAYIFKLDKQIGTATVPEGSYLAVQITNNDDVIHTVYTDEVQKASCVTSPQTDPGYPLPELAAGILAGLGLAGLAVFIVIKRKKISAGVRI